MPKKSVLLIIMGVSGCGKSSVGKRVAARLGWKFLEGDSLHPASNITKMQNGEPLDDADRRPWLEAIGKWMDTRRRNNESAVITCSALKRNYRDQLRESRPGTVFAWLNVARDELERRMRERRGHFMPPSLLDSQLATLEPPADGEPAITIDANHDIDTTVEATLTAIKQRLP